MKKIFMFSILLLVSIFIIGFYVITNPNNGEYKNALVLGVSAPPLFDSGDLLSFIEVKIKNDNSNPKDLYMFYFGKDTKIPTVNTRYNFYYFKEFKTEGFVEKKYMKFNEIKIIERFEPVSK